MPRIGQNPMKMTRRSYSPSEVSVCTLVYIPELTTYWSGALEVLKASLATIRANSGTDFDLIVLDNGSCPEVCRYLEQLADEGQIDILIRCAENHGKPGAWNVLFPACPGRYIAYTDSDVLFGPGWLDETLKVFQTFENVGAVTGRPTRTTQSIRAATLSATLDYAETAGNLSVERGNIIPQEYLDEHERSLGRHGSDVFNDPNFVDVRLTRGDVTAYASASHFQFMMPRETAMKLLPIATDRSLGGENEQWDRRINELGLLRLSLSRPFVWHVGNTLDGQEVDLLNNVGSQSDVAQKIEAAAPQRQGLLTRAMRACARQPRARRMIEKAYASLFEALR
jgi:glycosyltransferase involved in cell wall biosynthesis